MEKLLSLMAIYCRVYYNPWLPRCPSVASVSVDASLLWLVPIGYGLGLKISREHGPY